MYNLYDSTGRKLIIDRTNGPWTPKGGYGGACHYEDQNMCKAALVSDEVRDPVRHGRWVLAEQQYYMGVLINTPTAGPTCGKNPLDTMFATVI